MELEAKTKTALRRLTQAIAHNDILGAMREHKVLYEVGKAAIPYIEDALFQLDLSPVSLSAPKAALELRYVTALVSLIHDIDESKSASVIDLILRNGCAPIVARRLESICEFTINDYVQYEIEGVRLFEHKELHTKQDVRPMLEKWIGNVPDAHLREVERVYIINRSEVQDYVGQYMPVFCNVTLVWDNPYSRFNPASWLSSFLMEYTLYHEIGHHVHRHTFGQGKVQGENEADKYAFYILWSSHPRLSKILRAMRKLTKLFRHKA